MLDFLFPAVPGVSGTVTLTANRDVAWTDLGKQIDLNGFTLNLADPGRDGGFDILGPGNLTGGITTTVPDQMSVRISVKGGEFSIGRDNVVTVINNLTSGGTGVALSAEQGKELKGLVDRHLMDGGQDILTTRTFSAVDLGKIWYPTGNCTVTVPYPPPADMLGGRFWIGAGNHTITVTGYPMTDGAGNNVTSLTTADGLCQIEVTASGFYLRRPAVKGAVKTTGDQVIGGSKTFSSPIRLENSAIPEKPFFVYGDDSAIFLGRYNSGGAQEGVIGFDLSGPFTAFFNNEHLTGLRSYYLPDTDGAIPALLRFANDAAAVTGGLPVGKPYWNTTSRELAINGGMFLLTGTQTISGAKTFSGQTELTGQTAANPTSAMTRGLGDARFLQTLLAIKQATEERYNATLADDSELVVAVEANSRYQVEIYLPFETVSATSQGFQYKLQGGHEFRGHTNGYVSAGAAHLGRKMGFLNGGVIQFGNPRAFSHGNTSGECYAEITGVLVTTVAANFAVQWAQNSADAVNAARLMASAYLKLTKLP